MLNPSSPEYPSSPINTGPMLEVNINGQERVFHWRNSLLRTFMTGLGEFDHIEYLEPDGRVVGIPMTAPGAEVIRQFMEDNRFPFRVDPIVDEATASWYAEVRSQDLEAQWDSFEIPEQ